LGALRYAVLAQLSQSLLKFGRFRGTKITVEIVDNRQEHLHAFAVVREAMSFLERNLPLSATARALLETISIG